MPADLYTVNVEYEHYKEAWRYCRKLSYSHKDSCPVALACDDEASPIHTRYMFSVAPVPGEHISVWHVTFYDELKRLVAIYRLSADGVAIARAFDNGMDWHDIIPDSDVKTVTLTKLHDYSSQLAGV